MVKISKIFLAPYCDLRFVLSYLDNKYNACNGVKVRHWYSLFNIFQFPCSNAFQTLNFNTFLSSFPFASPPRQLYHPFQQLKSFPTFQNTHTCLSSTTSSCPGASTGAEHLWLQRASSTLHTV